MQYFYCCVSKQSIHLIEYFNRGELCSLLPVSHKWPYHAVITACCNISGEFLTLGAERLESRDSKNKFNLDEPKRSEQENHTKIRQHKGGWCNSGHIQIERAGGRGPQKIQKIISATLLVRVFYLLEKKLILPLSLFPIFPIFSI